VLLGRRVTALKAFIEPEGLPRQKKKSQHRGGSGEQGMVNAEASVQGGCAGLF
jgi:hypothetical protein